MQHDKGFQPGFPDEVGGAADSMRFSSQKTAQAALSTAANRKSGDAPAEFLSMRSVDVARGQKVVLHDINLKIDAGEHVAILAPNGCGKSTLIKTITCECYPIVAPETSIQLLGRARWDVSRASPAPWSGRGASAGRTHGCHTRHRCRGCWILLRRPLSGPIFTSLRKCGCERTRGAGTWMGGVSTHLEEKLVGQMSAGEQRRIMIARALVHQPGMLLLDEPSNALDIAAQRELREALRLVVQQGTGVIMVTHHLADILPEIGRVIMMRSGRIVGDGPKQELLQANRLQELFGVELELTERNGYWHSW